MKAWLLTWFKAARAPFLVVSLLPALLAGAIAFSHGKLDVGIFIAATIGVVMAHSAGDFVDDYFDFKNGNLGNKVQQFHDSPLIDGKVTLKQVFIATVICLAIAFAAGLYVFLKVGLPVVVMVLIGLFIVLFYTSPPLKMNYRGFGETMLFLAFGPMIVVGMVYVLTGQFSLEAVIISLVPGIFTMNVGIVSNTFDVPDDIKSGKRTMPVRFGQANAVRIMAVDSVVAYLAVVIAVVVGILPVWTLLVLLSAPLAVTAIRHASQYADESHYTPAMGRSIALSSVATVLLLIAYLIQALV
ncbi:MAG: prenyltransferase [Anaerolineaceae bacterium]|nr:prenyltransferase [Anaerolineaceae bacterium]